MHSTLWLKDCQNKTLVCQRKRAPNVTMTFPKKLDFKFFKKLSPFFFFKSCDAVDLCIRTKNHPIFFFEKWKKWQIFGHSNRTPQRLAWKLRKGVSRLRTCKTIMLINILLKVDTIHVIHLTMIPHIPPIRISWWIYWKSSHCLICHFRE